MPTNEERRKVAQKLRNSDIERHQLNPMVSHATVTICGSSIVCIDEESLRMALDYLADLIEPEPTVDRDGLLELADDWIKQARFLLMSKNIDVYEFNLAVMYKESADEIRKACGEVE